MKTRKENGKDRTKDENQTLADPGINNHQRYQDVVYATSEKEEEDEEERQTQEKRRPATFDTKSTGAKKENSDKLASKDEEGSLDIGACSLCHCTLDYSDRAAFFEDDRREDYKENDEEDSYFFRPNDPYLPASWYDRNNALLYCDSCDRLYHQRCHFIPVFQVPRGAWHCLYCQSQKKQLQKTIKQQKSEKRKRSKTGDALQKFFRRIGKENIDRLFKSPPVAEVEALEREWETLSGPLKATALHTALKQVSSAISGQLATLRRTDNALQTWTSSYRNAAHFTTHSQELRQLVCSKVTCHYKIRQILQAVEAARRGTSLHAVIEWIDSFKPTEDFVERTLFPFGTSHPVRREPRTPEFQSIATTTTTAAATPPEEIVVPRPGSKTKLAGQERNTVFDNGISLESLTCCVCHDSSATDENDLILCDGAGCFRAYHQQCCSPAVTNLHEEDWFCPLCDGLARLLHSTQVEYMGEEWEHRRMEKQLEEEQMKSKRKKRSKKVNEIMEAPSISSSLKSWLHVDEVFPLAEQDYLASLVLRQGKRTPATDLLISRVLGFEPVGEENEEDDDGDEDSQFDLESFHEKRANERDDDSSHSSQATLVDMSSVELEIEEEELAALSEEEESISDDGDHDDKNDIDGNGWKRRLRRAKKSESEDDDKDPGKLDSSNIIVGKRSRAPVDYIRLNEAIFGDLPEDQAANLDGGEDFIISARKRRKLESDNEDIEGDDES